MGRSLIRASQLVGKYDGFFVQMRDRNRDKFDDIEELGQGNLVKGYRLYKEELDTNIDGFMAMYNELEFNRMVIPFMKKYGYKHNYISHMAHRIEAVEVRYEVYTKLPILIEQMNEYLTEKGVFG